ncbi:hypothetical protein, partial [Staphylococcus epidermidis]|uniref:hypothetical protein n=1 Tax=Staphylococcus epidermidis TaxID=1282 RepID=UPI0021B46F5D
KIVRAYGIRIGKIGMIGGRKRGNGIILGKGRNSGIEGEISKRIRIGYMRLLFLGGDKERRGRFWEYGV